MGEFDVERRGLALHLNTRRVAILEAWRSAIKRDPALTTGEPLPRMQLFDHIPAILSTFEHELRSVAADEATCVSDAAQESAAAHGLLRSA
jgi:hypothetical protein